MNNEKDEEQLVQRYIPNNYQTGANMFGVSGNLFGIVQGVILMIIPYLIIFNLGFLRRVSPTNKFGIATFFAAILGYFGFIGINGETLFTMITKVIRFNSKKRVAYYNPRVKKEKTAERKASIENNKMLPRDQIIAYYNQIVEKQNEKLQQLAKSDSDYLNGEGVIYQFEDDPIEEDKDKKKKEKKALWEKSKKKNK